MVAQVFTQNIGRVPFASRASDGWEVLEGDRGTNEEMALQHRAPSTPCCSCMSMVCD